MSRAGATPKEITSTSESSSAPKRVPVCDSRATRPSRMSSTPAKTMNQPAHRKLPLGADDDGPDPEEQVAQGERAGDDDDDAAHARGGAC